MKLNRLESTTQHPSSTSVERVRQQAGEVRRVEGLEGLEGDRQRSLQQELAEFDPKAIGPFEGGERVLQDARNIAAQLTTLGDAADALIKPGVTVSALYEVDDKV